jgi:hypothetical protein
LFPSGNKAKTLENHDKSWNIYSKTIAYLRWKFVGHGRTTLLQTNESRSGCILAPHPRFSAAARFSISSVRVGVADRPSPLPLFTIPV